MDNQPEATPEELDENALFDRLKGWFQDDWDHHSEWMDEAKEDFDFVSDNQWDDESRAILEEQGRPASTFNRVQPVVDSICGFEVGNRNEVRYFPRKIGASGLNEMLTNAAAWFRDQANADYEESDAFRDAVISGRGVTETRIDYTVSLDGEPRIERVDPLEVFPDKDARKPNFADARRIWRVRKLPLAEARVMFPDALETDLHASWATGEAQTSDRSSATHDYRVDSEGAVNDDDLCTIIECQWYDVEPFVRFIDGMTGEEVVMPEVEFAMLMTRLERIGPEGMMLLGVAPPLSMAQQKKRVYKRAFIGKVMLEGIKPTAVEGSFTYKFITGKRDQTQGHFYGVVRTMKDPQRWTNKLFSQIMHILNSNAKGGIMAERGAFEDDRAASESWARSDSITWLEKGGIQKIQPKPTTPLPSGQAEMLQFAMSSMPLVTGVNMEMLGMKDAAQAGVLEYQRRQAGVTILAPLFDSLRRYRVEQGRLLLSFIQAYLADGRLVKIIEGEQIKYLPLNRDQALGEYEVIVDEAPNSPNAKDRNFAVIQSLWPILQPAMTPNIAAEVVKYSPLPESLASKISEQLMSPPPPAPDPKLMELQAKAAMAQQDKQFEMAKLEREYALKAQIEMAKAEKDAATERERYAQQIQVEIAQGEADAAVKRMEVEYQNSLNERKFELEATLKRLDFEFRRELELMKAAPQPVMAPAPVPMPVAIGSAEANQLEGAIARMGEMMAQTQASMMAAITAPKEIVRGPDGRVAGVRVAGVEG